MAQGKQILIAIDDFKTAEPLVERAARLAGENEDYKIHLFHALGPLPPQLLESPGAEDPSEEERVEAKQEHRQLSWLKRERKRVQALMAEAKSRLLADKVPARKVETHCVELNQGIDIVAEIAKAARRHHCDTVVVGYTAYPWITEQFHNHVSDQLTAQADGFAVSVVR
jgi:nucleotide-binding universal stress UspA family protein